MTESRSSDSRANRNKQLQPPQKSSDKPNVLLPRDGRILSVMLASMGVTEIDPKIIPQLLEFAHRYTTDVFQDAHVYSGHAGKSEIDVDDVRLAIQGRVNHSFTSPPSKELIMDLAREKNQIPLPLIPEKYGIRLPHERHCLTSVNFATVTEAVQKPAPADLEPTPSVQSLPKMLQTGDAPGGTEDEKSAYAEPLKETFEKDSTEVPLRQPDASSGGSNIGEVNLDDEDDEDEDMEEVDPVASTSIAPDTESIEEVNRKRRLAEDDDYD